MNRYRKFVTSSVGFTFVIVGITGVIFKFFFKNHVLEQIHGWLGLVMVAAAIVHIIQNWRPLLNHFRDRRVFGLLIPIILVVGFFAFGQKETSGEVNPREVIHKLSQASANDVAKAFGKNVNSVFAAMNGDGLHVGSTDETVQELAEQNQRPPKGILIYFVK